MPRVESLCFLGYSLPGTQFNGIEVRAAGTQLINVCGSYYSGNGLLINGNTHNGNNSNLTKTWGNNRFIWNKGDGVHLEGLDTNAGIYEGIDVEDNAGYGINRSFSAWQHLHSAALERELARLLQHD